MALTLLNIVKSAVRRLPVSSTVTGVVGSNDPLMLQLLEMAQEEGNELVGRHDWSVLSQSWSFTVLTDPHSEAYPSDWHRKRVEASYWRSSSTLTPLAGPVSPDDWHVLLTQVAAAPGYWRRFGTGIQVTGVTADEIVSTEYVSKSFATDADQNQIDAWAGDGDVPRLPDRLFILGLRWRWKQSKGLEYAQDMDLYESEMERQITLDTSAGTISMSLPTATYPGGITGWPITVIEA